MALWRRRWRHTEERQRSEDQTQLDPPPPPPPAHDPATVLYPSTAVAAIDADPLIFNTYSRPRPMSVSYVNEGSSRRSGSFDRLNRASVDLVEMHRTHPYVPGLNPSYNDDSVR
ncbi:hypothetical protein EC973_003436 [Apophysomyces ossiformis]|uniref:Uncharacterized protein n=1 Tax=Apophysomyces ossiformis TaxID=679940 RepID=A0A8H7BLW1_9FUNG|nr:hypothetical protein EC973_003436 [Apophysomyces ossiformis]